MFTQSLSVAFARSLRYDYDSGLNNPIGPFAGIISCWVKYLFNELKGSIAGMSLMSEVSAQSPTARNIGAVLQASDRLFYIDVNDTQPSEVRDMTPKPGFIDRLLGRDPRQTFLISINTRDVASGFFDVDGNQFRQSAQRLLGHELGHALDIALSRSGGVRSQPFAVHIENAIVRELNPRAPLRHPTMNHGGGFKP